MPFYEFRCGGCDQLFEVRLSVNDRNNPQSCPLCFSEETSRTVCPTGFILVGDGWPGKNIRINNQMREKNKRLDRKQNEKKRDQPMVKLAPNVGGERVDSWEEAKRLAASKGKDSSTYDTIIHKEKTENL